MGREGDTFQSPEQQRDTVRGWAKLRGVEIAEWFEDIDKSGDVLSRPGLDSLLQKIDTGQLDGVAVARLDRLSRAGVADALRLVETIHEAGGQVAAVDLGLDPTTPFGEFGMTIMLALARMERRRIVAGWETSKANAVGRGVHIGPVPYGYRRQVDDAGRALKGLPLVPDERAAPIVEETYRLAAEEGLTAASRYLKRAEPERASEANHIVRMLARRVYLGEVTHGTKVCEDAHDPLVDRVTWERAQREPLAKRRTAEPFPLSKIATCAQCGEGLIGARAGHAKDGRGIRTYRCRATLASWKGVRCTEGTNVVAHLLEDYAREAIWPALERFTMRRVYSGGGEDAEVARTTLEAAERELSTFATDTHARDRLGERVWQQALDARADAVAEAQATFREAAAASGVVDGEWLDFPGTVLFDLTGPEDRGWIFDMMLSRLVVKRGRGSLDERVELEVNELPGDDHQTFDMGPAPPDEFLALAHAQEALEDDS